MGMNLGHQGHNDHNDGIMVEMNTTPLIDVMLVLLVMLIITIPVQTHTIQTTLPTRTSQPIPVPPIPAVIRIDVAADGTVWWDDARVDGPQILESRLRQVAAMTDNPPAVHLRPHRLARYEHVARVMAQIQRVGIPKFGIVGNDEHSTLGVSDESVSGSKPRTVGTVRSSGHG